MSIIGDVFKELFAMFLADVRLTCATLFLVAVVGALVDGLQVAPLVAGSILFLGSLAIVVGTASRAAKDRAHR